MFQNKDQDTLKEKLLLPEPDPPEPTLGSPSKKAWGLASEQTEKQASIREIKIAPTCWNKVKLFFINTYEVTLICMGLALSIYEDDISSLIFQLVMQVLLCLSLKNMGKTYIQLQRKISLGVLVVSVLAIIIKSIIMIQMEPNLTATYANVEKDLYAFGFEVVTVDGEIVFDKVQSIIFEVLTFLLTCLLVQYYSSQVPNPELDEPTGFLHHSHWLSGYQKLYYTFFFLIACDTFFVQNLIQMTVLGFMIILMYLAAYDHRHRHSVIRFAVVWSQRLYILQLAFLAFTQISYFKEPIQHDYPVTYNVFFTLGLILNDQNPLTAGAHVFMICGILGFGQLFEQSYINYGIYKRNKAPESFHAGGLGTVTTGFLRASKQAKLKVNQEPLLGETTQGQSTADGSHKTHAVKTSKASPSLSSYLEKYAPYVYIWILRMCSIVLAYYYYSVPAFFLLTWVLLSLIIHLVPFVNFTVIFVTPTMTFALLYLYFINIPGLGTLFHSEDTISQGLLATSHYGAEFQFPVIETAFFTFTIAFFILLVPTRHILKMQRDEFRIGLFQKLSDKNSNFLWQLCFYLLKRFHILVLLFVFVYGMQEVNVYYIGLLFFFIMFASSLNTYRRYCNLLVIYSSFFIWIYYASQLIMPHFDPNGIIAKLFMMVTFTKITQNPTGINQYLDHDIPYWQWILLFLYVFMATINYCFRKDKSIKRQSFENDEIVEYGSSAEYYESKCDHVLRKKFPGTSKVLNRIVYIFSNMMILIILIIQGFILAFQQPNVLFWGFLILSLTLQRVVVSAGDQNPKLYRRCARQSRVLKYYSMFVIILQVIYHFLTDKNFLAQYGFDDLVQNIFGPFSNYMDFIGLQNLTGADIKLKFVSQIAFYIMAVILEDYFTEQLEKMNELDNVNQAYNSMPSNAGGAFDSPSRAVSRRQTVNARSSLIAEIEEKDEEEDETSKIEYTFEKARYTVPFIVYKSQWLWRFLDEVALNFHLVTATVTVAFCVHFQISLFFSFYLICTVVLCIRASLALHNKIESHGNEQTLINVDQAHQINKDYMKEATTKLLRVRKRQWDIQYWLLIASMIIMYPTPFLSRFKTRRPEYAQGVNNTIFWMFWSGVYVEDKDLNSYGTYAPYYALVIVLIMEKYAQRWQFNRLQCTFEKITQFKTLEEQMEKIHHAQNPQPVNKTELSPIEVVIRDRDHQFVTIGEAAQECTRIESLYREETIETKELRHKNVVIQGIKRKYNTQYRNAMKVGMEQTSLFLLLLSAAYKSNLVSILYMILLLTFLLIKNKTQGMQILTISFGIILVLQYIAVLFNLTSLTSPYEFPFEFNPYPNPATDPNGEYIIPLYLKSSFLRENLIWTNFFGFDIERASLYKIWFDFVNLALMTVYFFWYGNPINSNNIKVSFSSTKSLEYNLNEYAKIQISKKASIIKSQHQQQKQFNDEDQDSDRSDADSEIAADDSHEYFLGATFYLNELKQTVFLYYFTKKAKCFFYIGWQVVTLIMIFLIALLCKSFMSIGYMAACVPLILFINDFFKQEQISFTGQKWMHPYYICGPIMIFSFVDIALQILVQVPWHQEEYRILQWFGFEKIWLMHPASEFSDLSAGVVPMFGLNREHLKYLIFKCMNMFFIFLQCRIYESETFKKFMKRDLRKLLNLAKNYKKHAITYRFNNWKLQQIVVSQSNIKAMYEGVAKLKLKIRTWQELTTRGLQMLTDFEAQKHVPTLQMSNSSLYDPLLKNQESKEQEEKKEGEEEDDKEQQIEVVDKTKAKKKVGFQKFPPALVKGMVIKELTERSDEMKEKSRILKEQKAKLGFLAKIYLCLHSRRINHIFFLSEIEESSLIKKAMQVGKRKICSELEQRMIDDVNMHFRQIKPQKSKIKLNKAALKLISENEEYKIDQMPKTSDFISWSNILQALTYAYLQAIASNFSAICYLFMTISQIVSGGLITIIYPFAVFGYALMEEGRPGKYFWEFMIRYTLFILFMKFIFQLDCWQAIPGLTDTYTDINDWVQIGLWYCNSTWSLFFYVLPEIVILLSIMGQQLYENLIGLYDHREIEIENIEQARIRYLAAAAGKKDMGTTFVQRELNKEKQISLEDEEQELIKQLPDEFEKMWQSEEQKIMKQDPEFFFSDATSQKDKEPFAKEIHDFLPPRTYTQIDDKALRFNTVIDIKRERKLKKKEKFIKKNFSRSSYFRRLFPLIKEQKPGMDLYAWITFIQFIICIYLISFYTSIDTEGTQNLESSSQFSINMVLVLFIQIAVMITERYVNRTNPRHVVKEIGQKKDEDPILKDDEIYEKLKLEEGSKKLGTLNFEMQKRGDTMMGRQLKTDLSGSKAELPKIILVKTRMTTQQVVKFFVQWILLIIYHALVFWYYPINSNYVIYGTPTCNPHSKSYVNYGCLSFHTNVVLIIFYIIFCIYFTLSAIQIRYGLPDYRVGSSLMKERNNLYRYTWLIYYNIPFLMELKTILDWCFTKTALDLMEWLQVAQFNSEMFLANISGYYTYKKKFGEKIANAEKWICGCLCVGIIMFFLVGPFLMFSNLSFIASYNLVTEASVKLGIKIQDLDSQETYQFPLYSATNALSINTLTEEMFENHGYNQQPETKFFAYDQVQVIKIKNGSETQWALSNDYRDQFQSLLSDAHSGGGNISIQIAMTMEFERPGPELAQKATNTIYRQLESDNDTHAQIIGQLLEASELSNTVCLTDTDAVQDIILDNFLITEVRLTEQKTVSPGPFPPKDVKLTYSCENFWAINIEDKGIQFIAFSDLISSGFFSATSIMGFYLGVALVVGQSFRSMFIYKGDRVFIVDSPNTGAMLNLINCIYIARIEKDTRKEEELFHIVLEILRSPELLKHIAGTSLRAKL